MPKFSTDHAIPDSTLAQLMDAGTIEIVDGLTSPRVIVRGREIKPELNVQSGRGRFMYDGGERYRVQIRHNGKRRKITLNRIVWLWYFGIIPDNCDVHHGDAGRLVDGLANLDCWDTATHLDFHYGANANDAF